MGRRSGLRLQQFINARDEVEAGIARIEGIKIGRKKQELHVGIEMVKLLEGRTTRLDSTLGPHTITRGFMAQRSVEASAR